MAVLSAHRFCAFVLAGMIADVALAAESSCAGGWFGARAQITRIHPAGGTVISRTASGTERRVGVDAVLCAGDVLVVPAGVRSAEVYDGSKSSQVTEGGTLRLASDRQTVVGRAAEFVRLLMDSATSVSAPPPRPAATSSRGSGSKPAEPSPIQPILPLRDLPRQRLTAGLSVPLGWRDGAEPYECHVMDELAESLAATSEGRKGWCAARVDRPQIARLVVRDAHRRSVGWNVAIVPWKEVPRPEWIDREAAAGLDSPSLTAWALWLWRSGSPQWRLQALAMLNSVVDKEWLAGYFVDSVLAETPPIRP